MQLVYQWYNLRKRICQFQYNNFKLDCEALGNKAKNYFFIPHLRCIFFFLFIPHHRSGVYRLLNGNRQVVDEEMSQDEWSLLELSLQATFLLF